VAEPTQGRRPLGAEVEIFSISACRPPSAVSSAGQARSSSATAAAPVALPTAPGMLGAPPQEPLAGIQLPRPCAGSPPSAPLLLAVPVLPLAQAVVVGAQCRPRLRAPLPRLDLVPDPVSWVQARVACRAQGRPTVPSVLLGGPLLDYRLSRWPHYLNGCLCLLSVVALWGEPGPTCLPTRRGWEGRGWSRGLPHCP